MAFATESVQFIEVSSVQTGGVLRERERERGSIVHSWGVYVHLHICMHCDRHVHTNYPFSHTHIHTHAHTWDKICTPLHNKINHVRVHNTYEG